MVQPHVVGAWALALDFHTICLKTLDSSSLCSVANTNTASRLSISLSPNGLCAEHKLKLNGSQVL